MTAKERSYEPIRLMEIELEQKKSRWLQAYGWRKTSEFIDSCWRWVKVIKGERMTCDMNEAVNIEFNYLVKDEPRTTRTTRKRT